MKTITTLIASVLIIASFHASANENKGIISITAPAPTEYIPEDVNTFELEKLKSNYNFTLPNIPEINQADVDNKEIEQLKVVAPAMIWGTPSDVDTNALESFKTIDA